MKLKRLKLQNVFAFGNQTQTIDFTDERSLNLLVGKNGAGKTSIINCLKLSLYFDQVPLNVSDVSNQINGNGYLAVDFFSRGHDWTLESFYTKTSLKEIRVIRDGVQLDLGKIPETKAYVRSQVLDLPYSLFANIVSLSMNDFKSFLSMTPKDTRAIRDRVFGFHVLNDCREANKEAQKSYEKEKEKAELEREFIERNLQHELDELERQKTSESEANTRREELNTKRQSLQEKLEKTRDEISQVDTERSNAKELDRVFLAIEKRKGLTETLSEIEDISRSVSELQKTYDDKSARIAVLQGLKDVAYRQEKVKRRQSLAQKIKDTYNAIEDLSKEKDEKLRETMAMDYVFEQNNEKTKRNEIVTSARSSYSVYVAAEKAEAEIRDSINSLTDKLNALVSKQAELQQKKQDVTSRLQEDIKRLELLRLGQCPTCAHDFHSPTYDSDLLELDAKIDQSQQDLDAIAETMTTLSSDIQSIQSEQQTLRDRLQSVTIEKRQDFTTFNQTFGAELPQSAVDFDALYEELLPYDAEQHSKLRKDGQDILTRLMQQEALKDSYLSEYHSIGEVVEDETVDEVIEEVSLEKTNAEISTIQSETTTLQRRVDALRSTLVELQAQKLAYETELKQLPEITDTPTISREELRQMVLRLDEYRLQLELTQKNTTGELQSVVLELTSIEKLRQDIMARTAERIDRLRQTLTEKQGIIAQQASVMNYLDIVDYILSDSGLKSFIIKRQTPVMNAELAEILQAFDLNLVVRFDDEFHPVIYRFGQEVSAKTISLGQSKMIDFAIIVVIIRFLKNRCGDLNVIFLDEVFSSLHTTVLPTILETARRELVERLELNVFLVNHSPLSNALFDKKLEVSVVGNFSQITTEKTREE